MSYAAKIIADSIAPHGSRLTTFQVTFPRFILAEINTHRMLSRNSASSRAIPPEKMIERVLENPFVPETFNRRIKGMGVGEALNINAQRDARQTWISASRGAVLSARTLLKLDCDKSRINRLLEPYLWHTALITATEWDNFFALRQPDNDDSVPQLDHGAQPEFQIIARMMRDAMRASTPREINYGEWHLPYLSDGEQAAFAEMPDDRWWPMVSAGRCFVVSYDRLDEIMDEHPAKSYERADRGSKIGHWSPLEHPAEARPGLGTLGNFRGYAQLRKMFSFEENFQVLLDQSAEAPTV